MFRKTSFAQLHSIVRPSASTDSECSTFRVVSPRDAKMHKKTIVRRFRRDEYLTASSKTSGVDDVELIIPLKCYQEDLEANYKTNDNNHEAFSTSNSFTFSAPSKHRFVQKKGNNVLQRFTPKPKPFRRLVEYEYGDTSQLLSESSYEPPTDRFSVKVDIIPQDDAIQKLSPFAFENENVLFHADETHPSVALIEADKNDDGSKTLRPLRRGGSNATKATSEVTPQRKQFATSNFSPNLSAYEEFNQFVFDEKYNSLETITVAKSDHRTKSSSSKDQAFTNVLAAAADLPKAYPDETFLNRYTLQGNKSRKNAKASSRVFAKNASKHNNKDDHQSHAKPPQKPVVATAAMLDDTEERFFLDRSLASRNDSWNSMKECKTVHHPLSTTASSICTGVSSASITNATIATSLDQLDADHPFAFQNTNADLTMAQGQVACNDTIRVARSTDWSLSTSSFTMVSNDTGTIKDTNEKREPRAEVDLINKIRESARKDRQKRLDDESCGTIPKPDPSPISHTKVRFCFVDPPVPAITSCETKAKKNTGNQEVIPKLDSLTESVRLQHQHSSSSRTCQGHYLNEDNSEQELKNPDSGRDDAHNHVSINTNAISDNHRYHQMQSVINCQKNTVKVESPRGSILFHPQPLTRFSVDNVTEINHNMKKHNSKESITSLKVASDAILASMLFRHTHPSLKQTSRKMVTNDTNGHDKGVTETTNEHGNNTNDKNDNNSENGNDDDDNDDNNSGSTEQDDGGVPPAILTEGSNESVVSSVTEEASSFYEKNFSKWSKEAHVVLNNYYHNARHAIVVSKNKNSWPAATTTTTTATTTPSTSTTTKSTTNIAQKWQAPFHHHHHRQGYMEKVEEEHLHMFQDESKNCYR
jgi:hypothetical protein